MRSINTKKTPRRLSLQLPATSANLGPAFDAAAIAFNAMGRATEALAMFEKLQHLDSRKPEYHHGAGEALQQLGRISEARRAFEWFLGRNDLHLAVYDSTTGGCRDGLHPDRPNENQGAESTLAFLQSLLELRLAENITLENEDTHIDVPTVSALSAS